MKKILFVCAAACALLFTACNSCSKPEPEQKGYNYDEVVKADFDYIASQYPDFKFYEVDVKFKDILTVEGTPEITSIKTVFQVMDTCIQFLHENDMTDTIYIHDYYLECMPMTAYNAVNYDSCMAIIEPYRNELETRAMTFRRILAPPFPENGQYIFGKGLLFVDGTTGEVSKELSEEINLEEVAE